MATTITTSNVLKVDGKRAFRAESTNLPHVLPPDFLSNFRKLSNEQAGHLRHFHNLATQPDGEWRHMGAQDPGQEWLDAYRYQLAVMAYAAGAAHYHRLPALRSVFRSLLEQLIQKMLRREVWGYWYLTSQSGTFVDPDLVELRKPWSDPNKQENIMYSGHLLLMVSLHAMLFDDDKYDQPDALTFVWDPIFWGFGLERFTYSRSTLQQAILAEMEKENWLGVCCEPNCVFIVCNQFPIIAMRYNDVRQGTAVVEEVLEKYSAAWKSANSFVQEDSFFVNWYMVKQKNKVDGGIGFTSWACAFMNSWNSDLVHTLFPSQSLGFMSRASDGRVNLNDENVAQVIRELVESEGADPYAWDTMQKAREIAAQRNYKTPKTPHPQPLFAYIMQWVSEVADQATCDGLLCHADKFLHPTWENGGLFYPRNSNPTDEHGNWTAVDPLTGNAAIGYARLNVPDGQKKMWEKPWSKDHFSTYPFVDAVNLESDIDFLRGKWDHGKGAMVVTMRTWNGSNKIIWLSVRNLPAGQFGIYHNGLLVDAQHIRGEDRTLQLQVEVGPEETDLTLLKA